jgi:DNA-binding response OmpR family regulator
MYVLVSHHDAIEKHRLMLHLLRLGCQISVTSDPDRLTLMADEAKPDLLIVGFPALDQHALKLMIKLREHPSTSQLPLVVITPAEKADFRLQALDAGCDDFLTTSYSASEIDALVSRFMA